MFKKTLIFALVLVMTLSLASCGMIKDNGSYNLGDDNITSICGALGVERKMTGISTATKNGVQTKEYSYNTDPDDKSQAQQDINGYISYLIENEAFIPIVDIYGIPEEGGVEIKLAKFSVDEGKIIILEIDYNSTGYTLTFAKGEGTLDIY